MTIYTTDAPCIACAKSIIQSGIKRVVYSASLPQDEGLLLLMAAHIEIERLELMAKVKKLMILLF